MSKDVIVVGVDGSPGSEAAIEWCRINAPKLNAEVVAVHAFSSVLLFPAPMYGLPATDLMAGVEGEVARLLNGQWIEPLAGLPHRTEMIEGPAARAIIDVAEKEDAALIVVGARGRGGFAELLLGSVSHHVTHHAGRPVLVVPVGSSW